MLSRTTTTQLLEDLVDPANHAVWCEFDARYRPVLVSFSRRLGLSDVDAADAAQEALTRFARSYRDGNYDRTCGRLHSWLIGIARHCAAEITQRQAKRRERRGESAIDELESDAERLTVIWDAECRRLILQRALAQLRSECDFEPDTLHAFELLTIQGATPESVAAALALPREKVYLAKHRCLKKLRGIVEQLTDAFELDQR